MRLSGKEEGQTAEGENPVQRAALVCFCERVSLVQMSLCLLFVSARGTRPPPKRPCQPGGLQASVEDFCLRPS